MEKELKNIVFDTANKEDIPELIRLRIAYIADDFGSINESERQVLEEHLSDYFERRLGKFYLTINTYLKKLHLKRMLISPLI